MCGVIITELPPTDIGRGGGGGVHVAGQEAARVQEQLLGVPHVHEDGGRGGGAPAGVEPRVRELGVVDGQHLANQGGA